VVSDLLLPGEGGDQVIARARALAAPPPILVITGKLPEALGQSLEDIGADRVMFKPFRIAQLLEACRELIGEADQ